jgi:flagellar basal-body rod protein FlgF
MGLPTYVGLTRSTGLMREMNLIANNLANMSTVGFRKEGVIFSEVVRELPAAGGGIAMTAARTRFTDPAAGDMSFTGQPFDIAVGGDAFFQVETERGTFLTRAGNFRPTADGTLALPSGAVLLGAAGAPIQLPDDYASVQIGEDGTIATTEGPIGQIGLFQPAEGDSPVRSDGVLFRPGQDPDPAEDGSRVLQGTLEGSNISPVEEMSRMIAVQRAYEFSQSFITGEDDRVKNAVRTLGDTR